MDLPSNSALPVGAAMRRLEGRQAPQQHDRQPVEGWWWVLGPLCSAWGFFMVEVFGKFYESCGHRKKVTQKQTHFFQYGSLEGRNSWTTIWWNGKKFWAFWSVGFVFLFLCESWPSSFRLESIPDQQFALLISKDECVKLMRRRPCRIQVR